jgi:hypothetical protein
VPKPRVNLTRFHGVFAPNSRDRASVTPAKRGKGTTKPKAFEEGQEKTLVERRAAMTWAQRLKRVFGIDIETCSACGGALRIIACIEDPVVIKRIPSLGSQTVHPCTTPLTHLDTKDASAEPSRLPPLSGATAGRLVSLNHRSPPTPTSGCDLDGRGRAALGLMARMPPKIVFACGQFPGSGGWDSGRHRVEGGFTAA